MTGTANPTATMVAVWISQVLYGDKTGKVMLIWTTVAVALLLVAVIVHEAAHALVLRRLGFPIAEAGLGLPFAPRIVLLPSRLVPFRLSLSLWLVGAYVMPDPDREEEITNLPYRDMAWFSGAGVIANLLLGGAMLTLIEAMAGNWMWAAVSAIGSVALWLARRSVATYALPVLGLLALGMMGYGLATSIGEPIGMVGLATVMAVPTAHAALVLGCLLSFSLGVLNMIPIYPLDGGRIADALISRWLSARAAARFQNGTSIAWLCLMVYAVMSDILWLI